MPDLIKILIFGLSSFIIGHTATEKIKNEQVASISIDSLKNIYRLRLFKEKELEQLNDSLIIENNDFNNPFFISKSDSNENLKWVRNIGGSPFELPSKIINDEENNLYLIGTVGNQFAYNRSNGNGIDQSLNYTAYIVKFNEDGKEEWSSFVYGLDVYRYFHTSFYSNTVIIEGYFNGFYTKRSILPGTNVYWRR